MSVLDSRLLSLYKNQLQRSAMNGTGGVCRGTTLGNKDKYCFAPRGKSCADIGAYEENFGVKANGQPRVIRYPDVAGSALLPPMGGVVIGGDPYGYGCYGSALVPGGLGSISKKARMALAPAVAQAQAMYPKRCRKPSEWNRFVHDFANGPGEGLRGPDLFRAAADLWHSYGRGKARRAASSTALVPYVDASLLPTLGKRKRQGARGPARKRFRS